MRHPFLLGALVCAGLAVAAPAVSLAEEEKTSDDLVVARIDGQDVLRSDVMKLARNLPAQYQGQADMLFPMLLDRHIDMTLIGKAATDEGLADDPEVQERLDSLHLDIMREVYLERLIEQEVTDARLEEHYKTFIAENPAQPEINARHILLKTEAEARDAIARLDQGVDFAELAREVSTGPSAAQGGDLGYFTKEQMVPEFADAAFAMEPGSHSKEPVQTQFGWHVIRVEDRRTQPPPSFDELQEQVKDEVTREIVASKVGDLRTTAEIEIIHPGGKAE